jgi:hypothetical protein
MTHRRTFADDALAAFDRLDALSRTRALTEAESLSLEHCMDRLIYGPQSYGMRIALAKRGLLQQRRGRTG